MERAAADVAAERVATEVEVGAAAAAERAAASRAAAAAVELREEAAVADLLRSVVGEAAAPD